MTVPPTVKPRLGFALCGSFCSLAAVTEVLKTMTEDYDITPIFSERVASTDTRFGKAAEITAKIEAICGKKGIYTLTEAETVGPKKRFDILVIAPCTGNTLSKLASGITDGCVTMTAKAHLRNARPLLLAPASNDALGVGLKNFGMLTVRKHIFFVPFGQDDPINKPTSLVADFSLIPSATATALQGIQLQPMLLR